MTLRAARRLTLLMACSHAALDAQALPDRSALQLFRDSLEISRDTVALHALEARVIGVARVQRDDALLHLRLGFVALRIQELGGASRRIEDAASEFQWAVDLHPDWPYPWFGLGLAEARAPDRVRGFAGGLWSMLGIDRDTRAGAAFARAIQADPGFVEGILAFAETARSQRIGAPVAAALDALRQVQSSPLGWDPQLLLERGRLERLAGDPDSARVAFARAVLMTPDADMARLELARTLPLTADPGPTVPGQPLPAELAYYRAAASEDPEVVAMLHRDLQPIVDDSTLAAFDTRHGDQRVAWLRNFWGERAALDLREPGERLSEHYRRWDYALRHYRLPPFRRSYRWGVEIFQSHDQDLDDRGIIWLRHGAPTVHLVWPRALSRATDVPVPTPGVSLTTAAVPGRGLNGRILPFVDPIVPPRQRVGSLFVDPAVNEVPTYGNETWRYARSDGDVVLHFVAQEDPDDYRLVESILELDVSLDALAQHERELPGLAALLTSGPVTRSELWQEDRLRGRRNIALATTTNSWTRSYRVTMGGRAQWLAAGVRDSVPLVHIVYAVDAGVLRLLAADPRTGLIPITVRAVFFDTGNRPVATLDTVQMMRRPGAGVSLVAARAELPVPPGVHHMRLNVEANQFVGAVYPLDTLAVPDVHGTALTASSILIGLAGRALPWEAAPGDTVWLGAQNTYRSTDTLAVFLETYGLRPATPYTLRIAVKKHRSALQRLLAGPTEAVTVSERLTPAVGILQLRRAVSLQGLTPGRYELEVSIDGAGQRVVRHRGMVIGKSP